MIKIEDPGVGGDVARYVPPFAEGEDSLFFETFNRNKRSISLDLKAPEGRAAFEKLVAVSDVVFSNLRGDQPRASRSDLCRPAAREPAHRLLLALGLRHDGPSRERGRLRLHDPGHGGLGEPHGRARRAARQERALARRLLGRLRRGDRDALRRAARAPRRSRRRLRPLAVRDRARRAHVRRHVAGEPRLHAAAHGHRARIDGAVPDLRGGRWQHRHRVPQAGPVGASVRGARAPRVGGRPALRGFRRATDERCRARPADRAAARDTLRSGSGSRSWRARACRARRSTASSRRSPTSRSRPADGIWEYEHPVLGRVRQAASPLRMSDADLPNRRAPRRGEHTEAVLRELCGYDDEAIARLEGEKR